MIITTLTPPCTCDNPSYFKFYSHDPATETQIWIHVPCQGYIVMPAHKTPRSIFNDLLQH